MLRTEIQESLTDKKTDPETMSALGTAAFEAVVQAATDTQLQGYVKANVPFLPMLPREIEAVVHTMLVELAKQMDWPPIHPDAVKFPDGFQLKRRARKPKVKKPKTLKQHLRSASKAARRATKKAAKKSARAAKRGTKRAVRQTKKLSRKTQRAVTRQAKKTQRAIAKQIKRATKRAKKRFK